MQRSDGPALLGEHGKQIGRRLRDRFGRDGASHVVRLRMVGDEEPYRVEQLALRRIEVQLGLTA